MSALANSAGGDPRRARPALAQARVDTLTALRDAGITAAIAFALFLPLIGFQTTVNGENALILTTRWPLLFGVVGAVGVHQLLADRPALDAGELAFEPPPGPR